MGVLDSFRFDGKVVILTGASSGLGVAFAKAFAEAGVDLVWPIPPSASNSSTPRWPSSAASMC